MFLAGVFKIVGENADTTGITMDGLGKLTSRNIFKSSHASIDPDHLKKLANIDKLFIFIMLNLKEIKSRVSEQK